MPQNLDAKPAEVASVQQCSAQCAERVVCLGFALVDIGDGGGSRRLNCWLKRGTQDPRLAMQIGKAFLVLYEQSARSTVSGRDDPLMSSAAGALAGIKMHLPNGMLRPFEPVPTGVCVATGLTMGPLDSMAMGSGWWSR